MWTVDQVWRRPALCSSLRQTADRAPIQMPTMSKNDDLKTKGAAKPRGYVMADAPKKPGVKGQDEVEAKRPKNHGAPNETPSAVPKSIVVRNQQEKEVQEAAAFDGATTRSRDAPKLVGQLGSERAYKDDGTVDVEKSKKGSKRSSDTRADQSRSERNSLVQITGTIYNAKELAEMRAKVTESATSYNGAYAGLPEWRQHMTERSGTRTSSTKKASHGAGAPCPSLTRRSGRLSGASGSKEVALMEVSEVRKNATHAAECEQLHALASQALVAVGAAMRVSTSLTPLHKLDMLNELELDTEATELSAETRGELEMLKTFAEGEAGDSFKYQNAAGLTRRRWETFLSLYQMSDIKEPTTEMVRQFAVFLYKKRLKRSRVDREGLGDSAEVLTRFTLAYYVFPEMGYDGWANLSHTELKEKAAPYRYAIQDEWTRLKRAAPNAQSAAKPFVKEKWDELAFFIVQVRVSYEGGCLNECLMHVLLVLCCRRT